MDAVTVIQDSDFDMSLKYKPLCCTGDVNWPRYTLSGFLYDFNMVEGCDDSSGSALLSHNPNADGKPIRACIALGSPMLFET